MFDNIVYKDGEFIDKSWIKWLHWGVPAEENVARELIRNVLALLFHCLNCTALSGCYFAADNKPENILTAIVINFLLQNLIIKQKQIAILGSLQNIFLAKNIRITVKLNCLDYWDF